MQLQYFVKSKNNFVKSNCLKGLRHEMNIFGRLILIKKYFLYNAITIFCFLFDEKIKLKVLSYSFESIY